MKAICLKEIDSDGNAIWEMVNEEKGECIDYFGSPDDAKEYASSHGIEITEFVVGDWKETM